jgi:hypothetical protein
MADPVDQLKEALAASTDLSLAKELGVERSTVAQWRRRGALPARYQAILDADERNRARKDALAARRFVYGDGAGMFLVRAALAVIPVQVLDFPELSPALRGDHRERAIINVAEFAARLCPIVLGKQRCETEEDYDMLVEAMLSEDRKTDLAGALMQPTLGEHL